MGLPSLPSLKPWLNPVPAPRPALSAPASQHPRVLPTWGLVLLCHKLLARFDAGLALLEILTRGGGLWVSKPARAAANNASRPMSRRSLQHLAMPIGPRRSTRIVQDCCCPASARASNQ